MDRISMNRYFFTLVFWALCTSFLCVCNDNIVSSAITFELNDGRLGDNFLSYARAKYLSYLFGIPLSLTPFPYYDQLKLSEYEQILPVENFSKVVKLPVSKNYTLDKYSNILYVNHWYVPVSINWNDMVFVDELKKMIAPRYDIKKVTIPEGYLSVAVHVRNGGGFGADTAAEKERCPLRFVSNEFFIDQIARIARMFPDEKLYIYIFTDHKKPAKLVKLFRAALDNEAIVFDYQKEENGHNLNVLEDFFSMMQFDCLIRPGSHFSRFVERLGDAKLVIYPHSYKKQDNKSVIDVVGIKTRTAKGWKTVKEVIA